MSDPHLGAQSNAQSGREWQRIEFMMYMASIHAWRFQTVSLQTVPSKSKCYGVSGVVFPRVTLGMVQQRGSEGKGAKWDPAAS